MRVFLDTNVLVSAFATRGICADVLGIVVAEHDLVVGETVLCELRRVLVEKMGVPPTTVDAAERFLRDRGTVVNRGVSIGIELCDPDDVPVLEEAVGGEVDALVTGDRDLLEVAGRVPMEVTTPRGFWELLRS